MRPDNTKYRGSSHIQTMNDTKNAIKLRQSLKHKIILYHIKVSQLKGISTTYILGSLPGKTQ